MSYHRRSRRPRRSRRSDEEHSAEPPRPTHGHGAKAGLPAFLRNIAPDAQVHQGPDANAVAREHRARAVTIGPDVYVGDDAPDLATSDGHALLAHELTHAAQQRGAPSPEHAPPTKKGDRWEHEAQQAASAARAGRAPAHAVSPSPVRVAADDTGTAKPDFREVLQKRYGVTIAAGDRDWAPDDLKDLEWALAKLDKREIAALSGYEFKRWSTKEKRTEVDKDYTPPAVDECGFHELTLGGSTARISMYDECFDPDTKMGDTPFGRFSLLHEIGHAMESAAARAQQKSVDKLNASYDTIYDTAEAAISAAKAAEVARDALVEEYNAASDEDRAAIKPRLDSAVAHAKSMWTKADTAKAKVEPAEKARDAAGVARTAALKAPGEKFGELTKGKDALSDYSKTDSHEAFAEAFALYKVDPAWLKKRNKKLHDWFKANGPLPPKGK